MASSTSPSSKRQLRIFRQAPLMPKSMSYMQVHNSRVCQTLKPSSAKFKQQVKSNLCQPRTNKSTRPRFSPKWVSKESSSHLKHQTAHLSHGKLKRSTRRIWMHSNRRLRSATARYKWRAKRSRTQTSGPKRLRTKSGCSRQDLWTRAQNHPDRPKLSRILKDRSKRFRSLETRFTTASKLTKPSTRLSKLT